MLETTVAADATDSDRERRILDLLASPAPTDQVSGLALWADSGAPDGVVDWARHAPEVVLAAVDLCQARFGESAAWTLLDQWMETMGGAQKAGETAHTLLLEARLPLGGGSAALDLMIGVNDPQAVFVGLYEFAVNYDLPPAVRAEALIRLQNHMESADYPAMVRECVAQVRDDGDSWADRAERQLERLEKAKAGVADRAFMAESLSRPYAGLFEDLELFLRHGIRAGRIAPDAEGVDWLRNRLAQLDETALAGSDRMALARLKAELDSWAGGP